MTERTFIERQIDLRERLITAPPVNPILAMADSLALHALCEVSEAEGVSAVDAALQAELDRTLKTVPAGRGLVLYCNNEKLELPDITINELGFALFAARPRGILPSSRQAGLFVSALKIGPSLWDNNLYFVYKDLEVTASISRHVDAMRELYRDAKLHLFYLIEENQKLREKAARGLRSVERAPSSGSHDEVVRKQTDEIARLKREVSLFQTSLAVAHERLRKGGHEARP